MRRVWRVIFAIGLVTMVCYLLLCFAVEDYSRHRIPYAQMLFLNHLLGPVLLIAVLFCIIGSVGMLVRVSNKSAILLGAGATLISIAIPFVLSLFNVYVFNVHVWASAFIAPVATGVVIGMIFMLVGSFRAASRLWRKNS